MNNNGFIEEIVINNFRNYSAKKIQFCDNFNIIVGDNGIGKTNILEAISLFSNSKGLRGVAHNDLINIDFKETPIQENIFASLHIKLNNFNEDKINILYRNELEGIKKQIKINNNSIKKATEVNDYLKISWLTPQMDGFFINDAANRRKFLDKTVELLYSNHYNDVKKYEFFMKERIKILTTQSINDRWLDIVERKIAKLGVSVATLRNEVIKYLNVIFEEYTSYFPTGELKIAGDVEGLLQTKKAFEVEDFYANRLKENRVSDSRNRRTLFGIHKSDLEVFNKNKNMRADFCSTGEQKMLLISLIIARCVFIKKIDKGANILLLDEMLSHLDKSAKNNLFRELKNLEIQTFISAINKEDFKDFSNNFIELK